MEVAQKKGIDFRKGKCATECRKAEAGEEGKNKGKKERNYHNLAAFS